MDFFPENISEIAKTWNRVKHNKNNFTFLKNKQQNANISKINTLVIIYKVNISVKYNTNINIYNTDKI